MNSVREVMFALLVFDHIFRAFVSCSYSFHRQHVSDAAGNMTSKITLTIISTDIYSIFIIVKKMRNCKYFQDIFSITIWNDYKINTVFMEFRLSKTLILQL